MMICLGGAARPRTASCHLTARQAHTCRPSHTSQQQPFPPRQPLPCLLRRATPQMDPHSFSLSQLQRPCITAAGAAAAVEEHWGWQVVSCRELGGYEDKNFLVDAAAGSSGWTGRFVAKVHNPQQSGIPGFVEAQSAACLHVAGRAGVRVPAPAPTADSRLLVTLQLPGGASKLRLLQFLEGVTLRDAPKSPALLRSVGRLLARIDDALASFSHPGVRPTHDWSLAHVADAVHTFGHHLAGEPRRRAAANKVAGLLTQLVLANDAQLRKQMVHGDANENNIIVDEATGRAAALIDWSDVLHTWLVAEVAIAGAYVMLMALTQTGSSDEALAAVAHVLGGYTQSMPLSDLEWRVLPVLMAGRLVASTVFGLDTVSRDPSNAAYVLPDVDDRWRCIDTLLSSPPEEMAAQLRAAAETSTTEAASAAVVQQQACKQLTLPVRLPPFKLELYLAQYEHLPLQLSRSSCQPLGLRELLALADEQLAAQWRDLQLGYPPNAGSLQYREAVASHYPGTCANDVLSCVPNEGLYITLAALLGPGDVVVVMFPGYQTLVEVPRATGATVKLWSMRIDEQSGAAHFDLEDLRVLMTPDVKLLVVNLPHNPSGWLPTPQQWQGIVDCAAEVGAWLLGDEVYRLLEPAGTATLAPAVQLYPRAGISVAGLSKAHGLQGLRAGWVVCRQRVLLEQAERVKSYISTTGTATSELLAAIGLRNEAALVGRCRGVIDANTQAAAEFFSRWPSVFEWAPPTAGTLCLPRLITGEPIESFCKRAVEGCGVVILPATVYDHDAASRGRHFRLGLGRTNFRDALAALEAWLQQQQQQQQGGGGGGS